MNILVSTDVLAGNLQTTDQQLSLFEFVERLMNQQNFKQSSSQTLTLGATGLKGGLECPLTAFFQEQKIEQKVSLYSRNLQLDA